MAARRVLAARDVPAERCVRQRSIALMTSADRGLHGRGWPRASGTVIGGGYPRPPELVEPQPAALSRPAASSVLRPHACGAARLKRASGLSILAIISSRHAGVASRRLELVVSEQGWISRMSLAIFEQMGCEGMTQRMERERLAQPRGLRRLLETAG